MTNDPTTQAVSPAGPEAGGSPLRFKRLGFAVLVLLAAALLAAFVPRWLHAKALAKETAELAVPTVQVAHPEPGKPQSGTPVPADVEAWSEAPIYARATGYLKRWAVDIGAQVKAGQALAEIETPELDQELDQARHQLAQAQAALSLAKITEERYAGLVKSASVSEQENAEKQADLALKAAQEKAALANVRRLEQLKGFALVTAPFAGTVTQRNVDVGDLVAAGGGKPLFRLAQTGRLRVYADVPQNMAAAIAAGQRAEVLFPERPNETYEARVLSTAGALDPSSRTLRVELELDNAGGCLLAGSYAQVRFTGVGASKPPLTLPGNTLIFRAEGPQVAVVEADGKVDLRSIKLGRDFGQTIEVLSGVAASDRVILNPADSLVSGVTVRVAVPSGASGKDAP
ncbi:MAG: efflux RND transporter periplasmic adaptor subunit [Acidobacteriota bacterium]